MKNKEKLKEVPLEEEEVLCIKDSCTDTEKNKDSSQSQSIEPKQRTKRTENKKLTLRGAERLITKQIREADNWERRNEGIKTFMKFQDIKIKVLASELRDQVLPKTVMVKEEKINETLKNISSDDLSELINNTTDDEPIRVEITVKTLPVNTRMETPIESIPLHPNLQDNKEKNPISDKVHSNKEKN